MNMLRTATAFIVLILFVAGCKKSEKETPSGLKFELVKEGEGALPKKGDISVFNYVMKDSKDSIWASTYEKGLPGVMEIDSTEVGIEQMFGMLKKGDSAVVKMPLVKLFKEQFKQPLPAKVDSTLTITYTFKIEEVMDKESFKNYQTTLMEKKSKKQKAKDESAIIKYLASKNITAQRDSSGLHYVIHTAKGGKKPSQENCVEVNYKGAFMETGNTFDQGDNVKFPLFNVISGWRQGIPLLGIGDSATLYIPSEMAYGPQGYPGRIPPDAILIFDVKLLSINDFDPATNNCKD